MIPAQPAFRTVRGVVALRALLFMMLWVILIGTDPVDVIAGVPGVVGATWASLLLLPAGSGPLSPWAAVVMLTRLPWQSLQAGVDVARRALDPRLPLNPGLVRCPSRLPPGPARNAFRLLMSLQPGSMPVSIEAEGDLVLHCLDTGQPVAAQVAAEEAVFLRLCQRGAERG